ncbi:MAG: signal peptide peptidase SppA [Candidatus Eiseniibacteriota bacterium]|nr:MAG: signal peptide peptidase SppA [Candidatus Eisenbacteria bacterium]
MAGKRPLIALLVFFGVLIIVAVLIVVLFVEKPPEVKEDSYLVLNLGGELQEEASGFFDLPFLEREQATLADVIDCIDKAGVDDRIKGMIVKITPFAFGWGKAQEIRDKLVWFSQETDKSLVAYMISGGDKEYYLASVCEKVFMPEASDLQLDGLTAEVIFMRGSFDKLGITPELEHIGRYKSASDVLTQKTFTDAHREVTNAILDDAFLRHVEGIAEARGLETARVRELIDSGDFSASEAFRAGLVDSLVYEDQLHALLGVEHEDDFRTVPLEDYVRVRLAALKLGKGPKIALVYAVGAIEMGKSSYSPLWGKTMGSETMVEALRDARTTKGIRAIIMRVDSPGGSGLASDIIWREVNRAADEKPFVVSMSDVAGSGGYYIAMAADTIVAQPGTLTGSIGLVSGKFANKGLYDKLGMNKEILSRGANAAMFSDARGFTPTERRKLLEQMWEWYSDFVRKVAEGRDMSEEDVDRVARGRVWSGAQAREIGLVDELGGLERAIEIAKAKAGIPEDSEVTLVVFPKKKASVLQRLLRAFSSEAGLEFMSPASKEVLELLRAEALLVPGQPHYVMPFHLVIE